MLRSILVALLLVFSAAPASPRANGSAQPGALPSANENQGMMQAVHPNPREICLVCKRPIGTEGVVYLVNGQRVPLHVPNCLVKFKRNPRVYLAALQPRGAFLGAGGEQAGLSMTWFLVGLYVLVGLAFAALCAQRALSCGRNPVTWFGVGLAFNAFGYLALLMKPKLTSGETSAVPEGLGKVPTTSSPVSCPKCGEGNHPSATKCLNCGAELHPAMHSEVEKAGLKSH